MKKLLIGILFSTTAFAQSVTPKQVIEKYIDAIGGKEKFAQVEDMTTEMAGEVMGQTFELEYVRKAPNKFLMIQSMGGMEASKTVFNGESAKIFAQGSEVPVTEEQIEAIKKQSGMLPELMYLNGDVKLESGPNETVEGEDCYMISITTDEAAIREYYSVASGLKIKQEVDAPNMTVTSFFKDYKSYGSGLLFPTLLKQEMMGMSIETKVTKLLINSGVADTEFDLK